jgi:hypothetical protein
MKPNLLLRNLDILFKDYKVSHIQNNTLIKGKLPTTLIDEIYEFIEEGYKIRNHSLGFLKYSSNKVNHFSFNCPLDYTLFNKSFLFPFLNYIGGYFLSKFNNQPFEKYSKGVHLRKFPHTTDNDWDVWINFANKGNDSVKHGHIGTLSGIIYVQNTEQDPTCFEGGYKHYGKPGEIILFPSSLIHWVEPINNKNERITIAFNIIDHNQ